jgi:quinolinate synthase
MNYNNYISLGIDNKIKNIQNALHAHLGFSGVDFYGRVQKVISKDGKALVPEIHVSSDERKEVYFNDNDAPGGNVFFVDANKHTTKDGVIFKAEIKIVFMLNLQKLIPDKEYRTDTEVQDHCMKLVQKLKMIEITSIEKGLKNILSEFDIERIKKNDMNPYHTFAITGNLKYMFNCKN